MRARQKLMSNNFDGEPSMPSMYRPARPRRAIWTWRNWRNWLSAAAIAITVAITLAAPAAHATLPAAIDGERLPSLAPMLETIRDAVVNLSTTTRLPARDNPLFRDPFFRRHFGLPQRRRSSSLGSAVIVDAAEGYVVTNHHLIDKADEIRITTADGRELGATVVGSDADSDIAVLQVNIDGDDGGDKPLTAFELGDSGALRVGDFVVAIGNPFGLNQTVTSGIVSGLGRSELGIEDYEDFIQTDASINPGNSGGALVDLRGRLIGINTAIFRSDGGSVGIGFAIPIDMVKTLMAQLIEHGDIRRGLLGVAMQDLTPSLADAFGLRGKKGAVVSRVIPDSGAADAGLREGDVIVGLNDTVVDDSADLRNAVGLLRAGAEVRVAFYRDGDLRSVTARIKDTGGFAADDRGLAARLAGARFRAAPGGPGDGHDGGVEVTEIAPDSAAADSGLQEHDIVLSVGRRPVKTLAELETAVRRADRALLMKLLRDRAMLFLVIQ